MSGDALPPPGWYPDPECAGGARWWDGQQWGMSAADYPGSARRGGRRLLHSTASNRVNDVLWVGSGLAALVCLAVALTLDLTRRTHYPNVLPLLFVGVPLLLAGQLWVILVLNARSAEASGTSARSLNLLEVFGGHPWIGAAVLAAALLGVVSFLTDTDTHRTANPAGVLLFFYAFHWGVEAVEHDRRRAPAGPGSST